MEQVKEHLLCAITKDFALVPMHTPCGHLFDFGAIITWLTEHDTCPVCRRGLILAELVYNPVVEALIKMIKEKEAAEVVAIPLPTKPMDPFLAISNHEMTFSDFSQDAIEYLNGDRVVDLCEDMFNQMSVNVRLATVVDRHNEAYIRSRLGDIDCNHLYAAMRKYTYQTSMDSDVAVARHLALQGYYVYDLFKLTQTNSLNHYILYSFDIKADGSRNQLSKHRRI